jgi:hypothetical protein
MTWRARATLALLLLALAAPIHGADRPSAVGLVTSVEGRAVEVGPGLPLFLGQTLLEGERLRLAPGARITVLYSGGAVVEYRGAGEVEIKKARGAGPLGSVGRDAATAIFEARSRGESNGETVYDDLRSDDDGRPIEPRGEAVMPGPATFRWSGRDDGEYSFILAVAGGEVLAERIVKGTSFACPVPLPAGERCVWSVAPRGGEDARARFTVLHAEEAAAVRADRAAIERGCADADARALLLGLLFERHRLYHPAIARLAPLEARDPSNRFIRAELAWLYEQVGDSAAARLRRGS